MPKKKYTSRSILIPTFWTGDEALGFAAFLEQIIITTWAVHGEQMAQCLRRAEQVSSSVISTVHSDPPDYDPDPDLPF